MSKRLRGFLPKTSSAGEKPVDLHGIDLMAEKARGRKVTQSTPSSEAFASKGLRVP